MIRWVYIATLVGLVLLGCSGGQNLSPRNFSELYKPYPDHFSELFSAFHINDSVTRIYFNLNSRYFLHTRKSAKDSFNIEISMACKLYNDMDNKSPILEKTYGFSAHSEPSINKEIQGYFDVPCARDSFYFLEINTRDLSKNKMKTSFVEIDKTNKYNHQNFLVCNTAGKVLLSPIFTLGDTAIIYYTTQVSDTLMGTYLHKKFNAALPPFTYEDDLLLNFTTKEPFEIYEESNFGYPIIFHKEGIYYLKKDTTPGIGMPLYCFDSDFPAVKTIDKLVECMRYITTQKEYKDLTEASDKVDAFEKFWLNIAKNSQEKARELIKEYYVRVQRSNELFTSFTEGWKTDRGMIYLVYGPPTIVYKSKQSETWVYGESNGNQSLNFVFTRIQNPLSNNDFVVNRSSLYRTTFYRSVERWRNGNILQR